MTDESDASLVDRYRTTGNARHLEVLVVRHTARVWNLVYPLVLNHGDADDLTQEVFLRALKGLGRLRNSAYFGTWLHRIAINASYDFLRRRRSNPVEAGAAPPEPADGHAGPAGELRARELGRDIERALARLSPKLRAAISLTAIQGLSVREAARIEGCLAATMYWRVHEARRILRGFLGEHLGEAGGG